jgi:hypothetical protein
MYQNAHMEEIGLTGLTKILRGGVRIIKNPLLCYVDTLDWKAIVAEPFYDKITIQDNEASNVCPNVCPGHCEPLAGSGQANIKSCWNREKCQRLEVSAATKRFSWLSRR